MSVSFDPLQVGCPFCNVTACKQVLLMLRWPHLMCYNSCMVWLALDTLVAIPLCGDKKILHTLIEWVAQLLWLPCLPLSLIHI